jgi:RHS repeat-associated protein
VTAGYTNGRLSSLTHSGGQSITLTYDENGLISRLTDHVGRQTNYFYDATGNYLLSVQGVDGLVTTYTYETTPTSPALNALTSVGLADGSHTYFVYDGTGRLTSISHDGGAEPLHFNQDSAGGVSIFDGVASSKLYFDELGFVSKLTDSASRPIHLGHDNTLRPGQAFNGEGAFATANRDSKGRLTSTSDLLGFETRFTFNSLGRVETLTDAIGSMTRFQYDAVGNLTATIYPDRRAEQVLYNAAGLPESAIDRSGRTVSFQHNLHGQLTRRTLPGGEQDNFGYDARGNLIWTTDQTGMTIYDYDNADRLTKVTYPSGRFLSYTYDAFGRRNRMTDQAGVAVNYAYDALGRLMRVSDGANSTIAVYAYDSKGNLARKDLGNGTYATYEYDLSDNLAQLTNYAANGAINSTFNLVYDDHGRVILQGSLEGEWTYSYDTKGQLTRAIFASASPMIPNQDLSYTYDALGNRVLMVANGASQAYTANNMNQITSAGTSTFLYDVNGNLILKREASGDTTYVYDALNRMVRVSSPTDTVTFEYDALGNRVAAVRNGQRTEYLIDPTGSVDVVGEYNSVGNPVARYIHGIDLVSRMSAGNGIGYYDFDPLGSTTGITNGIGSYVNTYAYLPFGERLMATESIDNPFEFVGEYGVMHDGNGLHFMRSRYYDASLGRFHSPDPLRLTSGEVNLYLYAGNEPTDHVDATGTISISRGIKKVANALKKKGLRQVSVAQPLLPHPFAAATGSARNQQDEIPQRIAQANSSRVEGASRDLQRKIRKRNDVTRRQLPAGQFVARRQVQGLEFQDTLSAATLYSSMDMYQGPGDEGVPDCGDCVLDGAATYGRAPSFPGMPGGSGSSASAASSDPNSKTGNRGAGPFSFVPGSGLLAYQIDFENETSATAPAQDVLITDALSTDLDWSTFELTGIRFGDRLIVVPSKQRYFQTVVPMTDNSRTFEVQIVAGIDTDTGTVFAQFLSIDPRTSLPPDVLTGFLPPEDDTGRGQGFITFVIKAMPILQSGAEIRNVAVINFDRGTPIETNQIDPHDPSAGTSPDKEARVTIDAEAPTSAVAQLPPATNTSNFLVTWAGDDEPGGSGVAYYDIYVSIDNARPQIWQSRTTSTSATYAGVTGHTFAFYSVAIDQVGHVEKAPIVPDTMTTVTGGTTGDFNGDTLLNIQDLDALISAIAGRSHPAQFDLTADLLVNLADRDAWLILAGNLNLGIGRAYLLGDANLDGFVDGSDFGIWNANKFTSRAEWSRGDFTADGVVDGSDFGIWNANKFRASFLRMPWSVTEGGSSQRNDSAPLANARYHKRTRVVDHVFGNLAPDCESVHETRVFFKLSADSPDLW